MKRTLIILTLLLACVSLFAQQKTAKVTLKNGTSFSGVVTDFDPTSHVTIVIAGFEKKIDMADVESVEDLSASAPSLTMVIDESSAKDDPEPDYPSTYTLKVGPYEIEMVLVKGATFSMGYDGPGSRTFFSEPVHSVKLSSFYINKDALSKEVASYLKESNNQSAKDSRYFSSSWKDANEIVELIAKQTSLPIRLISEAEWEYTATTNVDFFSEMERNYCLDYFSEYISNNTVQIDPVGPKTGSSHVTRIYSSSVDFLYNRNSKAGLKKIAIRFTMPASCVTKEYSK